ncbi:hypothetical protein QTP88_028649 [Uroleucon formosanum]
MPAKLKLVEYFIKSDTLDHVLARMTALDGFPFIVFITSNGLRQLLISKGYSDLPKSVITIRNRVVNFSLTIRKEIIDKFKQLKNTGLIRVNGSMTAENCICVLKERLSRFDISLEEDIVAIVTNFKRSPTKNDTILQNYVKAEHGKEIKLFLDCKTRWNSLLAILAHFILLKTSIQKSLIDLNHPVSFEDSDYNLITEITDVLAPIKFTVEAIGRRDSNLCIADVAFKFLFKELSEKNSVLANKMGTCLSDRIKKRRRPELSGVLSYLQNPHDDYDKITYLKDIFLIPKNDFIRKQIIKLIERINYNEHLMTPNEEEQHCFEQTESESIRFTQLTLKEKLEIEIGKSKRTIDPITQKETDLIKIIKKEMNLFENGGTRGHHLKLAFKYLMSISPTSIESERAFSTAAYIGNKLRSRLGDGTLDDLLFLRSYFKNN